MAPVDVDTKEGKAGVRPASGSILPLVDGLGSGWDPQHDLDLGRRSQLLNLRSAHQAAIERLNWIVLTVLALLSGAALLGGHFRILIEPDMVEKIALASATALAAHHLPSFPRLAMMLVASAQLAFMGMAITTIEYVGASAALPLQDANLARADALLGLDWPTYYRFFIEHSVLLPYATLFYLIVVPFGLGIPVVLAVAGDRLRLQRFVLAMTITVFVICAISFVVPAMGAYFYHGLDTHVTGLNTGGYTVQLERLPFVRDGSLRVLELSQMGGIIMFPSFHAASGILSVWALWRIWWLRPVVAILSGGMVLVTPLVGGHYFTDVIAGIAIAALAIWYTQKEPDVSLWLPDSTLP
jgi:hypothetical protein